MIGNCSGFYGDRLSAMREMLEGAPDGPALDVLTGDYLAELTMLILGKDAMKDPSLGYARTFVRQVEDCLGLALERGVKIVSNAGGLNPAGLAARLREIAAGLGLDAAVAHVEGDDLRGQAAALGFDGALTANAYLGGFGIAAALAGGADIVVTGRVTDASLVVGPAVARFGWTPTSYDELAGAVVAGHVLECGTQATGGNFSGFRSLPHRDRPLGFPLAEIARRRVVRDHQARRHRRGGHGRHGHRAAGLRDPVDALPRPRRHDAPRHRPPRPGGRGPGRGQRRARRGPARAAQGVRQRARRVPQLDGVRADRARHRGEGRVGARAARALAHRELGHLDPHRASPTPAPRPRRARPACSGARSWTRGRSRSPRPSPAPAVELALGSYPGFTLTAPPGPATPYGVYRPELVDRAAVTHTVVHADGSREVVADPTAFGQVETATGLRPSPYPAPRDQLTRRMPLGTFVHARSGDKGGDANLGLWVAHQEGARPATATSCTAPASRGSRS